MEPKLGRLDANLARILERLGEAAAAGATWSSSRSALSRVTASPRREEGLAHAVSIDSARYDKWLASCERHRCFCVFGLLERDGSRLFNACVLAGPKA